MDCIRIRADNGIGYMEAYLYDSIFTEFPGKSKSPVIHGRANSITTWSGGGVGVVVPGIGNQP